MKEKIEALIEENKAIAERSPWLDVSLGGLRTALENLQEHEAVKARKPAAQKANPAAHLTKPIL